MVHCGGHAAMDPGLVFSVDTKENVSEWVGGMLLKMKVKAAEEGNANAGCVCGWCAVLVAPGVAIITYIFAGCLVPLPGETVNT